MCRKSPQIVAVIDDDESFRIALVESLYSLGYDTREFASAEEFLAGEGSCDYVVTDVHMPGMSGLDLKRLLTARGSKMPVIMITARAEPELEAIVAFSDVVCLLRKPFEADALIDCPERALKV
jgi:FixJ family two-component response regulator